MVKILSINYSLLPRYFDLEKNTYEIFFLTVGKEKINIDKDSEGKFKIHQYTLKEYKDRKETAKEIVQTLENANVSNFDICIVQADDWAGASLPIALDSINCSCKNYVVSINYENPYDNYFQAALLKELSYIAPRYDSKIIAIDKRHSYIRRIIGILTLAIPYFNTFFCYSSLGVRRLLIPTYINKLVIEAENLIAKSDKYIEKLTLDEKNMLESIRDKVKRYKDFMIKGTEITKIVSNFDELDAHIKEIVSSNNLFPLIPDIEEYYGKTLIFVSKNRKLINKYYDNIDILETNIVKEIETIILRPAKISSFEHTFFIKRILKTKFKKHIENYYKNYNTTNAPLLCTITHPIFAYRTSHIKELNDTLVTIYNQLKNIFTQNRKYNSIDEQVKIYKILYRITTTITSIDISNFEEKILMTKKVSNTALSFDYNELKECKSFIQSLLRRENELLEFIGEIRISILEGISETLAKDELRDIVIYLTPSKFIKALNQLNTLLSKIIGQTLKESVP